MKRMLVVLAAIVSTGLIAGLAISGGYENNSKLINIADTTPNERSIKITAEDLSSLLKGKSETSTGGGTFSVGEIQWSISNAYLDNNRIVIAGGEFYNVTKAAQDISIASGNKGTGFRRIFFESLEADDDFAIDCTINANGADTKSSVEVTGPVSRTDTTATLPNGKVTVASLNLQGDEGSATISFSSITYYYSCGTAS